jgi:hypothetical protein
VSRSHKFCFLRHGRDTEALHVLANEFDELCMRSRVRVLFLQQQQSTIKPWSGAGENRTPALLS